MGHVEGPKKAREDFQHVAASTWSRWVGDAIGDARYAAGRPAAEQLTAEVARLVPSPGDLSPGVVVERPAIARDAAKFFKETLVDLQEDAKLMREYSTTTGPDGVRKLKNPVVMKDSARMRVDTLRMIIDLSESVYDQQRMQSMFDAIVEEIGKESRECAMRIVNRLRDLNAQFGMVLGDSTPTAWRGTQAGNR
ncbi:hypothetical protein [Paraburkholderia phenoliruptrix]|uniref:hypothetical protein n=1 Tax=Paraburkholderia phenoliruptrix TaxID=252970 RepID=UPI001C500737|nr:hypothetical protein [Paraburkholderia phenoliruptrix]MBW0449246.1 hypothetical protein [Paraburkholderia phenoliruptrix]MBW9097526.1 hypothetical protein [Paraburkholderia phenoliruptrix]